MELHVTTRAVDVQDADDFVKKCSSLHQKYHSVYNFNETMDVFIIHGSVATFEILRSEVCENRSKFYLAYPTLMNFYNAQAFCAKFTGNLFVPEDNSTNFSVIQEFQKLNDSCQGSYSTTFWIGIITDEISHEWVKAFNNDPVEFSLFSPIYYRPLPSLQCVSTSVIVTFGYWYSTPCLLEACAICSFTDYPKITIKGLCKASLVENVMYLTGLKNNKWYFTGDYYSTLFWDNKTWVISNNDQRVRLVRSTMRDEAMPFGKRVWSSHGDQCPKLNVSNDICINN